MIRGSSEQQKESSQAFWDLNPCGSGASWERSREIRYAYTDSYLEPILTEAVFADKDVLEVGCGQGFDAAEIVDFCRSYVGLDMSRASLKVARQEVTRRKPEGTPSRFLLGDAEHLPFSDDAFDLIYSIGVLHHTPGFEGSLDEIWRVLKPGGTFVVMLYRAFTPLWLVLRSIRGFFRVPLVGRTLRRKALDSLRNTRPSSDSMAGTALLELIGCPVISSYTLMGLRRRFRGRFKILDSECHRVGFEQMIRVLPPGMRKKWPQETLGGLENRMRRWLGFYLLVTAEKQPASPNQASRDDI